MAQRAIDAEALCKSRVPSDRTSDLAALLKDHRFTVINDDRQKKTVLSIYIHLLPLVRHLDANLSDLVDIVSTGRFSLNTGLDDGYTVAAVELIKRKKEWTLKENLREMILLARECGLTCYSYHGTNLRALDNILKNGLGSTTRDYDPKMIANQKLSGSDPTTFYVASRPDYSYSYSLNSPEWAYMTGNFSSASQQEEARKYQAYTEVALVQIRRAPKEDLSEKIIAARVEYAAESNNHLLMFQHSIASRDIDEKVQADTFRPLEVVYYRLPKLKDD